MYIWYQIVQIDVIYKFQLNVFDWPDMNLRCKICITKLFSKMKNSFPNQLWHAISWIGVGSTYNTKTTQSQTKEYWHPIQVEWPAILLYQLTSFTKLLFKSVGNQIRNLWFRKFHQGFGMYLSFTCSVLPDHRHLNVVYPNVNSSVQIRSFLRISPSDQF